MCFIVQRLFSGSAPTAEEGIGCGRSVGYAPFVASLEVQLGTDSTSVAIKTGVGVREDAKSGGGLKSVVGGVSLHNDECTCDGLVGLIICHAFREHAKVGGAGGKCVGLKMCQVSPDVSAAALTVVGNSASVSALHGMMASKSCSEGHVYERASALA